MSIQSILSNLPKDFNTKIIEVIHNDYHGHYGSVLGKYHAFGYRLEHDVDDFIPLVVLKNDLDWRDGYLSILHDTEVFETGLTIEEFQNENPEYFI